MKSKTLRILDAQNPEPQDLGPGSEVYDLWVSGMYRGNSRLRANVLYWARGHAAEGSLVQVNRGNVQVATTQNFVWTITDFDNVWFPNQPPNMLGKRYRSEDEVIAALKLAKHSYSIPGGWRVVEVTE